MNIVDGFVIRSYDDGALVDVFQANGGVVYRKEGYLATALTDPNADVSDAVGAYFAAKHFDPEADDINMLYDLAIRRPLYLKGAPDTILKFFEYQGKMGE